MSQARSKCQLPQPSLREGADARLLLPLTVPFQLKEGPVAGPALRGALSPSHGLAREAPLPPFNR